MKILDNVTGVSQADCLPITKSAQTVLFTTDVAFEELETELITVKVVKKGSNDVYICRDMPLQQLIDLTLLVNNDELICGATVGAGLKTVAFLDLGLEAGILLGTDETINISLKGLVAGNHYSIYYNEEQNATLSTINFEQKNVNTGEVEKIFDVTGFEAVSFPALASISQIGLFAGGKEFVFSKDELRIHLLNDRPKVGYGATFSDVVPFALHATTGSSFFTIDLLGFDALKIYKTPNDTMQLYFVNHKEMLPAQSETAVRFGTSALASSVASSAMSSKKINTNLLRR